jgi:uncharacterized protein YdbL (DUF1318 family)
MSIKASLWLRALCVVLLASSVTLADEDSKEELRQRFKDRYPEIQKLKTDGVVGETFEGYLEPPGSIDDDARKLMDEENSDRRKLYQIIADEEGTTPEVVARRNAERNFRRAKPGEYLKGEDGKWYQKS